MIRKTTFIAVSVLILSIAGLAQESRTEVSVSGTGFFTSSANGNNIQYSTTSTGGVLATYRHHVKRWLAIEGAYGFDVNSQKYALSSEAFRIQSGIHQFTGSLVLNLPSRGHSRLNPYLVAGGGALLFDPTGSTDNSFSGASAQARGTFVYGLGLNYSIRKGIALRAEYRGLVYSTPDFGFSTLTTNTVTQSSEPSLGVSFRF